MNKTHTRRVQRLAEHIDTLPPTPAFVEEAFEHFRTTGELPEAVRLAEAVVERVLRDEAEDTDTYLADGRNPGPVDQGGQSDLAPGTAAASA
jgi:hypothetical protein